MSNDQPYCGTATLVKRSFDGDEVALMQIGCGSWQCPTCAKLLRAKIKRRVQAGKPDTFITLTVNPAIGSSATDRRERMAVAWKALLTRVRREYPGELRKFFCVVETTEAGEPHLHVAAQVKWISQKWLSAQWAELMGAPVVDIRRVRSRRGVARYLAKYLAAEPAQFKNKRRAWASRGWALKEPKRASIFDAMSGYWSRAQVQLNEAIDNILPFNMRVQASNGHWAYAATDERWNERTPAILTSLSKKRAQAP